MYLRRWNERGPDQAVFDHLADPLGIGDVGLAAGDVLTRYRTEVIRERTRGLEALLSARAEPQ
jgi:hypothetical protein